MSIVIININEYKTRYPDTALNGIRDQRIQSAINLAFSYLDVKCGCAISSRWELPDSDPLHLTTEQKNYVKEAFYVETQYILSNNMDFSQGADQTSFGSLSMSSSRPERKEVCDSALMYLQRAGLYDYLSFSSPSYAGSGTYGNYGTIAEEMDNVDYVTYQVGDSRYVKVNQEAPNKYLATNDSGIVVLKDALNTDNFYTKNQINHIADSLDNRLDQIELGYVVSVARNVITQTITLVDSHGNIIAFPYGGTGGGGGSGIIDVTVNGVSVVNPSGIAEIDLLNYAQKTYVDSKINDTTTSITTTYSSSKIDSLISAFSGVVSVQVVAVQPDTPTNNTMYYIGTASPYTIKLYVNDTWYNMGTSEIDLSGKQDLITSTNMLSSALVDDTSSYKKFVTEADKATWNAKSTVTGSTVGTSTANIKYLTIDGTEKKIYQPTTTSELTNDSGFITKSVNDLTNYTLTSDLTTLLADKQDKITTSILVKDSGNANHLEVNYAGALERKVTSGAITETYTVTVPQKNGILAITSDIPTISVSDTGTATDTVQYITINGVEKKLAGSSGGGTWGSITGTLSDQTDLQTALDSKIAQTSTIEKVWSGTLAEYNAITTKDSKTLYNITDDNASFSLQAFYDGLYPVNNIQFGLQAPNVPNGITATWTDISSEYEGRYFKVSSTLALGTSQNAMISKHYHTSISDGTWNLAKGGSGWTVGINQAEGGAVYGNMIRTGDNIISTATNVEVGTELRPLTTTIKVWKRTA